MMMFPGCSDELCDLGERWTKQRKTRRVVDTGSSGNRVQASYCTAISIRGGIVVVCWSLHSERGLGRCQCEWFDFSFQGLIRRLIHSPWRFWPVIRLFPFPEFFLQGCQAALTSPMSSSNSDGVTCLWICTLPCLWKLSILQRVTILPFSQIQCPALPGLCVLSSGAN